MNNDAFEFADWRVEPSSNLLINKNIKKKIEPKVIRLLVFLAQNSQQVVSREQLLDSVWEHSVLDDALTNTIAQLRKALGDNQSPKRYIETIPKKGYRLIPQVKWQHAPVNTNNIADQSTVSSIRNTSSDNTKIRNDDKKTPLFTKSNKISPWWFAVPLIIFSVITISYFSINSSNTIFQTNPSEQSVAVLPFEAFSDNRDIQYFADGLTEELIHQLATDPTLRVISRSSSDKFRKSKLSAKQIAKILGVGFIIEGSIRQSGNQLRTTVQLIDTKKDFNLWSKSFDNKVDELFLDTQTSIVHQLASLITNGKNNLQNRPKRYHPRSAEAYRLFLLAQSHMKLATVKNYEKAFDYYQRATNIAPDYALAYTGMAAATLLLSQYKHTSTRQAHIEAGESLDKAFAIQPDLAEAFAVRGLLKTYAQQFESAEQDYKQAIQLNPNLRFARHNYGYLLSLLLRTQESIEQWKIALEMDPLSEKTNYGIADSLVGIGEIEKGIEQFQSCVEILPKSSSCVLGLATVYGLLNDTEKFKTYLDKAEQLSSPNNYWVMTIKAKYLLQIGKYQESQKLVERTLKRNNFAYHSLKTELIIQLKHNQLANFSQKITASSLEYPNSTEVHFLLALTQYFEQNCEFSIVQYEKAQKEKKNGFFSVWDWTEGISHQLSLAYCYQQTHEQAAFKTALKQYQQFVEPLPKSQLAIPGKIFNQARYLVLINKPQEARLQLQKIKDWSFYWLVEKDPILKLLKHK